MSLQLSQIIERIDPAEFARVNEAHVQVTDLGSLLGQVEQGVLPMTASNDIFGRSCIVTYRPYGAQEYVEKRIRRRGKSPSRLIASARKMNAYQSHRDLTSYTVQEWVQAFGKCAETGRYQIEY